MLVWSINPQLYWLQNCLRTLFTSAILRPRASSSDLLTSLDIAIFAVDSELTIVYVARSITSSKQEQGVLQDLRVLVPTWIISSSGFLRKNGFVWSFISYVVDPGKDDLFSREFPDILWLWRCLRLESPVMMISFWRLVCVCSRSLAYLDDSVWLGPCLFTCVLYDGLPWFRSSFKDPFWYPRFLYKSLSVSCCLSFWCMFVNNRFKCINSAGSYFMQIGTLPSNNIPINCIDILKVWICIKCTIFFVFWFLSVIQKTGRWSEMSIVKIPETKLWTVFV